MSIVETFVEAKATLGLEQERGPIDAAALKRAYRKQVMEHAPDRDPEGFRRVRDAYELLSDPNERATAILLRKLPAIPPPAAPTAPMDPEPLLGKTAVAILRTLAARVDAAALLEPTAPAKKKPRLPKSP